MEDDARSRLQDLDPVAAVAAKAAPGDIGNDVQRVLDRHHVLGQRTGRGGEGERRLGGEGRSNENERGKPATDGREIASHDHAASEEELPLKRFATPLIALALAFLPWPQRRRAACTTD
jgi:hypothetical protein